MVLVYFFYEKKFELEDFLDAKTIVLALGTIVGAYFGASKAGEYSVNVMLEQQRLLKVEQIEQDELRKSKYKTYLLTRVKNAQSSLNYLLKISEKEKVNTGYLKSMREIAEDIQKVEMLFDNIDYLAFDEELIPKYVDLQVYLRTIVSISHTLRSVHEIFERDYESLGYIDIKQTDIYSNLREVTDQLTWMKTELANTIEEIESI